MVTLLRARDVSNYQLETLARLDLGVQRTPLHEAIAASLQLNDYQTINKLRATLRAFNNNKEILLKDLLAQLTAHIAATKLDASSPLFQLTLALQSEDFRVRNRIYTLEILDETLAHLAMEALFQHKKIQYAKKMAYISSVDDDIELGNPIEIFEDQAIEEKRKIKLNRWKKRKRNILQDRAKADEFRQTAGLNPEPNNTIWKRLSSAKPFAYIYQGFAFVLGGIFTYFDLVTLVRLSAGTLEGLMNIFERTFLHPFIANYGGLLYGLRLIATCFDFINNVFIKPLSPHEKELPIWKVWGHRALGVIKQEGFLRRLINDVLWLSLGVACFFLNPLAAFIMLSTGVGADTFFDGIFAIYNVIRKIHLYRKLAKKVKTLEGKDELTLDEETKLAAARAELKALKKVIIAESIRSAVFLALSFGLFAGMFLMYSPFTFIPGVVVTAGASLTLGIFTLFTAQELLEKTLQTYEICKSAFQAVAGFFGFSFSNKSKSVNHKKHTLVSISSNLDDVDEVKNVAGENKEPAVTPIPINNASKTAIGNAVHGNHPVSDSTHKHLKQQLQVNEKGKNNQAPHYHSVSELSPTKQKTPLSNSREDSEQPAPVAEPKSTSSREKKRGNRLIWRKSTPALCRLSAVNTAENGHPARVERSQSVRRIKT